MAGKKSNQAKSGPIVRRVVRPKPGPRRRTAPPEPPRPVPRKVVRPVVPPEPPCPWSEEELGRIVEEAVRFIAAAKERHGRALGFEVGTYLFTEVYRGDDAYLRSRDPGKDDSLRDIAKQTGMAYGTLYNWTVAAMMRIKMERAGFSTELTMRHLEAMVSLGDDIEAAIALGRWAEARKVRATEMGAIVKVWRNHIEGGGDWADLVDEPGPKRVGKKGRRERPRGIELVVPRLVGMLGAWARKGKLTEERRAEIRDRVLAIRARLER